MNALNYTNSLNFNNHFTKSNQDSIFNNPFFNEKPIFNIEKKENINIIEEIDKERLEKSFYYSINEQIENKGNSFLNSLFYNDFNNCIIDSEEENEDTFPILQNSFLYDNNNVGINTKSQEKSIDYKNSEKKEKKEKFPFIVKKAKNSTKLILFRRKRGRKIKKKTNRFHYSYSPDNLLRKINVHYLNFIISFLNDILVLYNYKYRFLKINYNFIKKINKQLFEKLKEKTIGDIISNEISSKYKKYKNDSTYNKTIYNIIKNNEDLNKILSDNYLNIFKNVYLKNNKKIDFKGYKIKKEIILLLKNADINNNYIKLLIQCIKKNFSNDINDLNIEA